MDHREAPVFDNLVPFGSNSAHIFSTPGHKRGQGAPEELRLLLGNALACDVPQAGGVDTTHVSWGLLQRAERLAADAYGGDAARFLVNGSTTGNLAMLLATCGDGDEVIISRMLHRSLLAGLILTGARPVYVAPELDRARNLPLDVSPATVKAALDVHPRAKAVALVSPSYVGVSSDLSVIAELCHARDMPLLIDEAWGPHFHFHPELPASAMQAGADSAVSSTHKLLSALTQGATLVARRGVLDLERLSAAVDLVQTTSPAAFIYASLDTSRRQVALHGWELLDRTLVLANSLRAALGEIDGLSVIGPEIIDSRPGAAFDLTRIMVDVHHLGLTGYQAEEHLRQRHGVYVEMSDLVSVMLLITIGDDERSIQAALAGFQSLVNERRGGSHSSAARSTGDLLFSGTAELTPRQAYLAATESVPVARAADRLSAETITPYPPGIPLVAPGERLTSEVIDYLRAGMAEGMYISGLSDPSFETVRVVR